MGPDVRDCQATEWTWSTPALLRRPRLLDQPPLPTPAAPPPADLAQLFAARCVARVVVSFLVKEQPGNCPAALGLFSDQKGL
jgi:hypothetical protein